MKWFLLGCATVTAAVAAFVLRIIQEIDTHNDRANRNYR